MHSFVSQSSLIQKFANSSLSALGGLMHVRVVLANAC